MQAQKKKVGRPKKEASKKLEDKKVKGKPEDLKVDVVFMGAMPCGKKQGYPIGKMVVWWFLGLMTGYIIGSMFQVNIALL